MPEALVLTPDAVLPEDHATATLIARVHRPDVEGPSVCVLRGGVLVDITSREIPTVAHLCAAEDPAGLARTAAGKPLVALDAALAHTPAEGRAERMPHMLAPVDLQAVKASGVTFVQSLLERVIEEQARGAPEKAAAIRTEIGALIGDDLSKLKPGSDEATALKAKLIETGVWSQYLEVGIGPDAEIFTKCPVLAAVGVGADVGVHPMSTWNNPEPEIVVVAAPDGRIVGATLGNDVNLRDVEGRSALLLGKAKDNNASAALGPFLRLFDDGFTLDDVRAAEIALTVTGTDGFRLEGASSMSRISRDPADLVAATLSEHHRYPDGVALYHGTMVAPVEDRDAPGQGFTHHDHDVVTIATPKLGALVNRVRPTDRCEPWTCGIAALMANLAKRGLLERGRSARGPGA